MQSSMRILIAGTHRCGSTWVANVLGQSPGIHNVYEPDSPYTDILGTVVRNRLGEYPSLEPGQRSSWYSMVWDLAFAGGWPWSRSPSARRLGRGLSRSPAAFRDHGVAVLARSVSAAAPRRDPHVIVKSANCGFSVEWIARRYHPRVVLQRRNPLNVVSSWMALNIEPDPLDDPAVEHLWLAPHGLTRRATFPSRVAEVAWTVGVLTVALKDTAARHPDWIVVSHDDLSLDPYEGFTSLFARSRSAVDTPGEGVPRGRRRPGVRRHRREPARTPQRADRSRGWDSRRVQQATQYRRRLTPGPGCRGAVGPGSDLPLGDWGVPARSVTLSTRCRRGMLRTLEESGRAVEGIKGRMDVSQTAVRHRRRARICADRKMRR